MTYPTVNPIVEMAFGADLTGHPSEWEWTDVSDRLPPQTITIKRGRADESSQAQPTAVSFELYNDDGALTPGNASSPHYPHVARGTPVRLSVASDDIEVVRTLRLSGQDGTFVSTPSTTALRPTGDFSVRFDGRSADWGRFQILAARAASTTNFSWIFMTGFDGHVWLLWSPDGTYTLESLHFASTSEPVPSGARREAWRVDLDVDNGAGSHTVTFYTAPTLAGPWTQFGDPVEAIDNFGDPMPGTTSVFAGTAELEIGSAGGGGSFFGTPATPFVGEVYGFEFYNGVSLVSSVDFTSAEVDASEVEDNDGRAYTLWGDARIADPRVRFVGQIDEVAPSWPFGDLSHGDDPGHSIVSVTASGMLRRLGQGAKPLHSTIYRAVTQYEPEGGPDAVIAYWPMEDGNDATQFASPTPGVKPIMIGGEIRPGSDSSFPASEALPTVADNQPFGWRGELPVRNVNTWRVDLFVKLQSGFPGTYATTLFSVETTGTVRRWQVDINASNFSVRALNDDGGELLNTGGQPVEFFDGWTQVTLEVLQEGGNIRARYAWLTLGGNVYGGEDTLAGTSGRPVAVGCLGYAPPEGGLSFGHMVVSTGTPPTWLGWNNGANNAYTGEPAGVRIERLCDEEGIPVTILGNPYETERMGPQRPRALLELLQECADADMGSLVEQRDGLGLVYRCRESLYNQAPALALDASTREVDGLVTSDIKLPFAPTLDDQRLRNDVTVRRTDGASARAVSDPPPTPGDRYDEEVEVNIAADERLGAHAGWRLHLGTWPGMRFPDVSTDLTSAPHLIPEWLRLDTGDRVTVENLPPQHPAGTVDLLAEGVEERIAPGLWDAAITASPGGPWQVGARNDADTRRDSDQTTTLDEFVAGEDTSFRVVSFDTLLWTTDPADFPFDIDVGGARLTVTAIGAEEGPGVQTFTVEATSKNGVVKPIPIDTPVRLWKPAYRAL